LSFVVLRGFTCRSSGSRGKPARPPVIETRRA
jgi:hypothetical protein